MTDDEAGRLRRARMIARWAKARHKARTEVAPTVRNVPLVEHQQTPEQTPGKVASRVQRAASEALAALRRQRSEDG